MSTHGDVGECPRCGYYTLSYNYDTSSHFQDGHCAKCGYTFWTAEELMNQQAIYDIRQEEDWDFNELTDEDRKKCAEFDKANGLDKPPHLDMILQDAYDGDRKLQAKAVHERHGIGVTIKGYGDALTEDSHGSPIFIENRNGKLFVCIWADINQEDPTHVIDMSEALENNRKESEETKYCRRCGTKLQIEKELDYPYYCPECDENMYEFETENRK